MEKTTQLLKDIETILLQAELRINMLNGDLHNPTDLSSINKILRLQAELDSIHTHITKLESSLLKKINIALKVMLNLATDEIQGLATVVIKSKEI